MSRVRTSRRGQAIVEFALILPIFFLVVIGIFEGGRAIYIYNSMSNAVRAGLREAIVHQDDAAIQAEIDDVLGAIGDESITTIDGSDCGTPVKTPCFYRIEIRNTFSPVFIGGIFSPVIVAEDRMAVESVNP